MRERSAAFRAWRLPACFLAALVAGCETEVLSMVEIDVEILPSSIALTQGDSATVSAIVRDSGGMALSGLSVTWTVDNPSVASVNSEGVVEGRAVGITTVRASKAGVSGEAQVRVWPDREREEDDDDDDDDDVCFLWWCI